MSTKAHPAPRPPRHFPEDEGLSAEQILVRRDARRVAHRAAQAAHGAAYRHELRLAKARTPIRGLPGERPAGALGALTEAYHRLYDLAYPGKCVAGCYIAALKLLAFLHDPWRLTDDPAATNRDLYTWTRHGLDPDLLALLPTPWRLVANRSIPRPEVLDETALSRLIWAERLTTFLDYESRGAPGEPADWQEAQAQAKTEMLRASAAGQKPDMTGEGPTMSARRFILRLWAQARREHWKDADQDPFLIELRRQLDELRANPHGGRRR